MGTTTAFLAMYLPADNELFDEQLNTNTSFQKTDAGIQTEHNGWTAHAAAPTPHTGHAVFTANTFTGTQTVAVAADANAEVYDVGVLAAAGIQTGERVVYRAHSYDAADHHRDFIWRARTTSNAGNGVFELLTLLDAQAPPTVLQSIDQAGNTTRNGTQTYVVGADIAGVVMDPGPLAAAGVQSGERVVWRAHSFAVADHYRDFIWRPRTTTNAGDGVLELLTMLDGAAQATVLTATSAGQVGIGVAPAAFLHVLNAAGGASAQVAYVEADNTGGTPQQFIVRGHTTPAAQLLMIGYHTTTDYASIDAGGKRLVLSLNGGLIGIGGVPQAGGVLHIPTASGGTNTGNVIIGSPIGNMYCPLEIAGGQTTVTNGWTNGARVTQGAVLLFGYSNGLHAAFGNNGSALYAFTMQNSPTNLVAGNYWLITTDSNKQVQLGYGASSTVIIQNLLTVTHGSSGLGLTVGSSSIASTTTVGSINYGLNAPACQVYNNVGNQYQLQLNGNSVGNQSFALGTSAGTSASDYNIRCQSYPFGYVDKLLLRGDGYAWINQAWAVGSVRADKLLERLVPGEEALAMVRSLQGKRYWHRVIMPGNGATEHHGVRHGFIVEDIIESGHERAKHMLRYNDKGEHDAIAYTEHIPILNEAVKHLAGLLDQAMARIAALEGA